MRILNFFLLLILSGCAGEVLREDTQPVFDLSAYMRREATRLDTSKASLLKTVYLDGKEETKIVSDPDWNEELLLAESLREDSAFWFRHFQVREEKTGTFFTAIEKDYPVRDIIIQRSGEQVTEIAVYSFTHTAAYKNYRLVKYRPEQGIFITGAFDAKGLKPSAMAIRSLFRNDL